MSHEGHPVNERPPILYRIGRSVKSLLISGGEMLLAVALVLFFALAFMGILMLSFPRGTGLVDLYGDWISQPASPSTSRLQGLPDENSFVAILASTRRRVRDRPADAITWNAAHAGMGLRDHHTIQTLARSAATITFNPRNELQLDQRSLVVVKGEEARRGPGRGQPSVVLLGGRVRGSILPGRHAPSRIGIVTAGGTSEIRAREDAAEYGVAVNPDESSTVYVFSGEAEVATSEGSRSVGPDQAITVDRDGSLGAIHTIADPPRPLEPPDGAVRTYGSVAPRVRLAWEPQPGADTYRLVLARDPDLNDIVYEGELAQAEIVHGDLSAGRYYWRITSVSDYVESHPGEVRTFRLVQDLDPPPLDVRLPEETTTDEPLVVRGRTEPGCELFIENEAVPLSADGTFEHAIELKRGLNMIVIEAVDAAGNSNYRSQYVTARY